MPPSFDTGNVTLGPEDVTIAVPNLKPSKPVTASVAAWLFFPTPEWQRMQRSRVACGMIVCANSRRDECCAVRGNRPH